MILSDNIFGVQRALAGAGAIGQAASNFGHITRATKILVLNARLHGALSLGPRLCIASDTVANGEQTAPAIPNSNRPNSSIENEATKPKKTRRHHNSSKSSRSDSSSLNVKALLGIFSSVYHSLAISLPRNQQTHQGNPIYRDKAEIDPLADVKQSVPRLLRQLAAPLAPVLKRALVRGAQIINEMAEFVKNNTTVSTPTKWAVYALGALWVLGSAVKFIKSAIIEPLQEGLRLVLSPVFALRWLATAADFGVMLAAVRRTLYFVLGGILAAIVALAVAAYELCGYWDVTKRLLSRWTESAHKAVVRLMKWTADKIRNAAGYAGNSIASVAAGTTNALRLPTAAAATAQAAATTRGMNRARAAERAAAGTRPTPMIRAMRRAAAAAAFVAPLMLAGASAGAFTAPLISTNDTARIAAPLSAVGVAQTPIVINYAPNVVIHSENAADAAALKRRVMEILERHGRELHQVLAREVVRQQRRDFVNPALDE